MDQEPKTVATSPPPQQPQSPKRWLSRTRTFFDVPNPRIIRIYLISSFATFSSGIAFFFEWTFHGKNHIGFQWIIYYALFLFFLPVLIWPALGIVMAVSSSLGSKQVASSVVEKKEECVDVSAGKYGNEETKDNNNCTSLTVVVDSDDKKSNERLFENKNLKLKRTVSFPLHGQARSRTR